MRQITQKNMLSSQKENIQIISDGPKTSVGTKGSCATRPFSIILLLLITALTEYNAIADPFPINDIFGPETDMLLFISQLSILNDEVLPQVNYIGHLNIRKTKN